MPYTFDPQIKSPCRVRHYRLSPAEMARQLHLGSRAARSRAGRKMRARKAGLISAEEQRHLGWPNLAKAWEQRRRKRAQEAEERALEERQREVEIWSRATF